MTYKCDLCDATDPQLLFKYNGRNIVKCNICDLVAISNPMASEEIKSLYEDYYSGKNGTADTSLYVSGKEFRIAEANSRLENISNAKSILEIGCATGFFLQAANDKGIKAIGIDISENACQYAKKNGLDARQGDLLYLNDFNEASFDVVTMWASIEHLLNPKATLQKVYDLLKENGKVVIETGDISSYIAKISGKHWRMIEPDHNFYFSSKTLDNMLKITGFKTMQTTYDGFTEAVLAQLGFFDVVLNEFGRGSKKSKRITSLIKERVNNIAGRIKLGDVMIKYARKIEL